MSQMKNFMHRPTRAGFTLAEVAFSLLIMVTAVVTVLLLITSSQRSQQKARIGIYAAAVATDLMTRYSSPGWDWRSGQNYNSPSRRTAFESKDGNVNRNDIRDSDFFGGRSGMKLYGQSYRPDLELAAIRDKVLVPLPKALAQRLDSPGDAIAKVLAAGGSIYYVHPSADVGGSAYGLGDRNSDPARQQMLVGVIGNAQQNTLPGHPMIQATRAIYPFPPQFQNFTSNSNSQTPIMFPYKWDYTIEPGLTLPEFDNGSFVAGDLQTELPPKVVNHSIGQGGFFSEYGSRAQIKGMDQQGTWEDQAFQDEHFNIAAENPNPGTVWRHSLDSASNWSPWRAGLPEIHRLMWWHWNRYYHQIRSWRYSGGSFDWSFEEPVYSTVPKTITELVIEYDEFRNPTTVERTRTIQEQVQTGTVIRTGTSNGFSRRYRGIPTPPIGLGSVQGARGTDIRYEDMETLAKDRWNQMRIGLPGLERRVMYRTAALALWGKVDGHGSITEVSVDYHPDPHTNDDSASDPSDGAGMQLANHVDPDDFQRPLNDPTQTGDPNIIKAGALPTNRNPLLTIIPPPTNPRDIHPAQVYALSHLAHAAMVVTGYKPPFLDWQNTLDANEHTNLVSDEDAPYKHPDGTDTYFLFHPFYTDLPYEAPDLAADDDGDGIINSLDYEDYWHYGGPLADDDGDGIANNKDQDTYVDPPSIDSDGDGTPESWPIDAPRHFPATPGVRHYNGRPLADRIGYGPAVPLYADSSNPDNTIVDPADPRVAKDMAGNPIVYKRVGGAVINPFPAPYADRGAFNWRGVAFWERNDVSWSGGAVVNSGADLSITKQGAFPMTKVGSSYNVNVPAWPTAANLSADAEAALVSDTDMARIAMENCLAWTMAFVRGNPYNLQVPRPVNMPVMTDRPLFAWNMFDGNGNSKRPRSDWDNRDWSVNNVVWGTDQAAWPTQYAAPARPWSFWSKYGSRSSFLNSDERYAPLTTQFAIDSDSDGAADSNAGDIFDPGGLDLPVTAQYLNPLGLGYLSGSMRNGFSKSFNNPPGRHGLEFEEFYDMLKTFNLHRGYSTKYGADGAESEWRMNANLRPERFWYDQAGGGISGRNGPVVADRTRQLVFWAVDWQAFEDAESLPSEPADAAFWSNPASISTHNQGPWPKPNFGEADLAWANPVRDGTHTNPPRDNVQFTRWADNSGNQLGNRRWADMRSNHLNSGIGMTNIFYTPGDVLPWASFGVWGADRNGNGVWDKGRVPPSSRMMAEEVARFPFYDTVIHTTIGN